MSSDPLNQVLLRIFDEKEFEGIYARAVSRQRMQEGNLCSTADFDTQSFLTQTLERTPSSQESADLIHKVESMSEEESDALDDGILTAYLAAKGVDVPAALVRCSELIDNHFEGTDTTGRPGTDARQHLGVFARVQSFLEKALSSTAWGAFTRPAFLTTVVTAALAVGIGVAGYSVLPVTVIPAADEGLPMHFAMKNELPHGINFKPLVGGADGSLHSTEQVSNASQPDSNVVLDSTYPTMETQARGIATTTATNVAVTNSAEEREFVFSRGDTLWDSMNKHGVSVDLQTRLAKKIDVVFHPGDKAVFHFLNGRFDRLVVIHGKENKITVGNDLKLVATTISRSELHTASGEVQSSLHGALAQKLGEKAAWRIAYRMAHLGAPVNTLREGARFEVQIERNVVPGGKVTSYGEIKYLRLDAGKQGIFEFDSKSIAGQKLT